MNRAAPVPAVQRIRVIQVDYWKLVVPCRPDTINSPGIHDALQRHDPSLTSFDQGHKWVIRLRSDSGHEGIGETGRSESETSVCECARAIDGFELGNLCWARLPLPQNEATYAFEIALLDLIGKIADVPVHQLLGGKVRDRVPIDYWMGRCTVEDTARRAAKAAAAGFHGIKIKCTAEDPVVERVDAIQRALPGATVTLDPNERFYDIPTARKIASGLGGRAGLIFESPVPQNELDWYVALRREVDIPIALHLLDPKAVLEAIGKQAADAYNLSTGSPTEFVFCARMCELAGCAVWHGSRVDLGILDMAHIHAAAAAPACTLPSDIIGNLIREDDLIVEPIRIEDGRAVVPDRPGLGVELDMAALEKYRIW